MGHDYLDIGDGYLRLNDCHIKTLGHFFAHCASIMTPDATGIDSDTLAALQAFFADWQCHGPGVFTGTDFNIFATSTDRYSVLRVLFDCTLDHLNDFGDEVPLGYLERHISTREMQFAVAQPISIYRDAIQSLIDLIPTQ